MRCFTMNLIRSTRLHISFYTYIATQRWDQEPLIQAVNHVALLAPRANRCCVDPG